MAGIVFLALGYALSQFFRSFLAVLAPVLEREVGASPADLSNALAAWFVVFALMQFPIGVWLDSYGPRRTSAVLLALGGGGGSLCFALATSPLMLVVAMALIGIGCAPVLMASLFLFARNHSPRAFATLGSTFIAVGTLGNILSSGPLAAAAREFGWREASVALAVTCLLVALGIAATVRDPERIAQTGSGSGVRGYLALFADRRLWPLFPVVLLGYAVAAGVRGLWCGPYLHDVHGLSGSALQDPILMIAIALAVGTLVYGPLDRWLDTRKWVVFAGNGATALAAAALALWPQPPLTQAVILLVAIGLFGANYAVQMAHFRSFVAPELTGRGVTLMNFFSIGGSGLMQFVTGRVFDGAGGSQLPQQAYAAVFGTYAALLGAALLVYLFAADARPSAPTSERAAAPAR